jgi:hypothetical protein
VVVPIRPAPGRAPLKGTVTTKNDSVLVSVKRKHLAGKPHFQEVSDNNPPRVRHDRSDGRSLPLLFPHNMRHQLLLFFF